MTELTGLKIAELRDGFRAGAFSAREVAASYVRAVESGRALNAFIVETPDHALAAADVADRGRASGELRALSGVPLGIQDLFATTGVQTPPVSTSLDLTTVGKEQGVYVSVALGGRR